MILPKNTNLNIFHIGKKVIFMKKKSKNKKDKSCFFEKVKHVGVFPLILICVLFLYLMLIVIMRKSGDFYGKDFIRQFAPTILNIIVFLIIFIIQLINRLAKKIKLFICLLCF